MALSTDYSSSASRSKITELNAENIDLEQLHPDARAVLDFWFDKNNEPYWFEKNDNFDQQISDKFGETWQAATHGECAPWRRHEESMNTDVSLINSAGRLAEIIVLDQFSRNLCRGQADAFAQDGMAVALAQEAIEQPHFANLPMEWRRFTIMPFMHSESAVIHERYLPLFEQLNDESTLGFELRHKEIIDRFGRYPHRNDTLDRESTEEEEAFLQQPNSSF
ncbi:DUF924 family protein [Psychrobacter jeotgali]|uniref:DUF924 family protein n=1 Tax=Psychrobacter jeotgali TaxID=179010 RepID=UPI00191AF1B4|nr:DUF924 family protein [Psychrobacter jeotgali]